ncbi:MAG: sugar ABC transporter ATP-binding protein [Bacteroidota bacterium]
MLQAINITKRFSGVIALNQVNLAFHKGKVNAIIGENGAGKSTLMKVLSGVYQDYEGTILLNGEKVRFKSLREAQEKGIAIIHQELSLIPGLSVTENIFLGREIVHSWGTLDKKAMRQRALELLQKLKLSVSPDSLIASLKVGEQQVVEIAKALLVDSQVIIMDEPTSAISESEVELLFEIIESLKKEGKAVVYISHKLKELFTIANRYIILRDGCTIESGDMDGMTQDDIIKKMVGRDLSIQKRSRDFENEQIILSAAHISLRHLYNKQAWQLKNISFALRKGEILGIFGLMGAGRTELLETLFGLHPNRCSGELLVEGVKLKMCSPSEAIAAGLVLAPEDRKKDGLVQGLDVKTNMTLPILKQLSKYGFLNQKEEAGIVAKYIGELKIKTSSGKQLAGTLSGGNQQKIVLSKWLAAAPKIIMLDEPTRGIDINAKSEIYKLIMRLAGDGLGIIIVSSELPEILALSDRILVMAEGTVTAEMDGSTATEDKILKAAIGAN